jgi:hypothetical protein
MNPSRFCALLVLLVLICAPFLSQAEEKDATTLIDKLTHDDFEIREAASRELESFPREFAARFLILSVAEATPAEAGERLAAAARIIFTEKIAPQDERWRRQHANLGITFDRQYNVERYQPGGRPRVLTGLCVNWIDEVGPCHGKLKRWDVIMQIDGASVRENDIDTAILAEAEHELTIYRYHDPEVARNRDFIDPNDTNYDVLKIKVRADWSEAKYFNSAASRKLLAAMWFEYRDTVARTPRGTRVAIDE